jgi:hypothetical protein
VVARTDLRPCVTVPQSHQEHRKELAETFVNGHYLPEYGEWCFFAEGTNQAFDQVIKLDPETGLVRTMP